MMHFQGHQRWGGICFPVLSMSRLSVYPSCFLRLSVCSPLSLPHDSVTCSTYGQEKTSHFATAIMSIWVTEQMIVLTKRKQYLFLLVHKYSSVHLNHQHVLRSVKDATNSNTSSASSSNYDSVKH